MINPEHARRVLEQETPVYVLARHYSVMVQPSPTEFLKAEKACEKLVAAGFPMVRPEDADNDLADDFDAMLTALCRLSNEVIGSLPLMEPLARQQFGNSNYAILMQRAEEARELVKRVKGIE